MIPALTIAEPVAVWLQVRPYHLRVHSAFPHAINLVDDEGRFLALLARDAGDGPFALRLPCEYLPDVPAGTAARVDDGALAVGSLLIDWQPAIPWNPTLKPLEGSLELSSHLLGCLHQCDSIFAHAFKAPSPSPSPNFGGGEPDSPLSQFWERGARGERAGSSALHTQFTAQAATHLSTLRAGLQGDDIALTTAVRGLVGFGEGLTPAGDDCLLGVLAARRMLRVPAGVLEAAIRECASRTTALSAAFLRAACAGEFAGHWHRLRDALESRDAAEIEGAVRKIKTHGATSGADSIVGWVSGAESKFRQTRLTSLS